MAKRKREPIRVIITNPEAIPIARDRLTSALIRLREEQLRAEVKEA
jgi:hypothetical protein